MNSLKIKYNNELYEDSITLNCDNQRNVFNFVAIVDDTDFINNYRLVNYSNNVTINRSRNIINVILKPNTTKKEVVYTIDLVHLLDSSVMFSIIIVQDKPEYSISVDKENITFDTLLDKTDSDVEYEDINVTCVGGRKDYVVGKVRKEVYVNDEWVKSIYDNALYIEHMNNSLLRLYNYGKLAMEDDVRYIVSLYHINDTSSGKAEITINYNEDHESGLSF